MQYEQRRNSRNFTAIETQSTCSTQTIVCTTTTHFWQWPRGWSVLVSNTLQVMGSWDWSLWLVCVVCEGRWERREWQTQSQPWSCTDFFTQKSWFFLLCIYTPFRQNLAYFLMVYTVDLHNALRLFTVPLWCLCYLCLDFLHVTFIAEITSDPFSDADVVVEFNSVFEANSKMPGESYAYRQPTHQLIFSLGVNSKGTKGMFWCTLFPVLVADNGLNDFSLNLPQCALLGSQYQHVNFQPSRCFTTSNGASHTLTA